MFFSNRLYLAGVVGSLLLTLGCWQIPAPISGSGTSADDPVVTLTLNPRKTYQIINHFGASDAWACQFVGNWPTQTKNEIADLLFSRDTLANGQPKGIGLSLWRFNIGAGTAEQGDSSGIKDEWRRAESFLNNDGTYDWNKQAGQLWFLKAAQQRGVPEFLGFPNSPPVQYTVNHKGFATKKNPNLSPDQYDAFGKFLATVVAGVRDKAGVTFQYLSPVNEPQWDWSDGGQEGTPFFNDQIAGITRSLSRALLDKKLNTKINIAEAGQIDYLYSAHNRPGRSNQITDFFQSSSPNYIGNLPNVTRAISAHSYFTTSPQKTAVAKRQEIARKLAASPGLNYWMSEYCILGDNDGEINGQGRDLGITSALYVASVIHNDLTQANASAWHWWIALSPYDYKDGLVYIDRSKTEGKYYPSKMLWALGNYSQFVRPGAVRIDGALSSEPTGLQVSAYRNQDQKLVTVLANHSDKAITVQTRMATGRLSGIKLYQTSADASLTPVKANRTGQLILPAKSITTLVGSYRG